MFDIFSYTFFQNAVIGIMLVSIASAIIGTYVVCRRMVFVTGGITHASFGGLGLGFYAGLSPALTAGIFAIASALGVEWLSTRQHVREDSAIGVVWALGMALGTIFIFLTPGYVPELSSFLFGNVLTIGTADLIAFGAYLAVLLAVMALLFPAIRSCAFDPNFARTQGLPVYAINLMMTVLTSVCIVLTIRLIGIMLVSIASAIIGTYVVCRRMVFVTGGITHASFGGLGLGFYAGLSPALTAGIFAIASALGVEWLSTRQHVREDSAIGVVWALGMALGTI
ncbi:MAG: metal ABC transporter permease, partial [Sodaliphilus sp.]|nr:metal ABC transporter permease [Sodaliphilus sp.]